MQKSLFLNHYILPQHAFFLNFVVNNIRPTKRRFNIIEYDFISIISGLQYKPVLDTSSYMVQRLFGFKADYIPKFILRKMDDDYENL